MGLATFDRLPPAQYRVAAWRVDTKSSTASQLADTYLLDWSLSRKVTRDVNTIVFPPLALKQDNRNGNLDEINPLPGQHLSAAGWAMDDATSSIPRMVLITCTDSTGATHLLGTTIPNMSRPDVVTSLQAEALLYSGYRTTVDVSKLPPGDYQIAAWDIDNSDEEKVVQMGNPQPLQIPLK